MNNKDVLSKVINKLDDEFSNWSKRENILPSRLDIFAAGYLSGIKNTKLLLEELFIEEVNKKVERDCV